MAIKNNDGTTFRLSHPNPNMSEQALWDESDKLIIHNKCGTKVVFDKNIRPLTMPLLEEEPEVNPKKTTYAVPVVDSINKKEDEYELPEEVQEELARSKIEVWCLPAYIEEKVDPLYGETYSRVKYKKKFMFEAILQEQSDFHIFMWTTTGEVTEGSILYPRTYDKRWWRVAAIGKDEAKGLYFIKGSITDYQPNF